jgi:hypothetical protein
LRSSAFQDCVCGFNFNTIYRHFLNGEFGLTFELAPHAFEYLSENNKSLVLVVVPLVSLMKDQKLAIWSVVEFLLPILGTTASQSEVTNMPHMRLDDVAQITLTT